VRKDKLTRLVRATRAGCERKVLEEVFHNAMAQIRALVAGEDPPRPRAASDPRFRGAFCGGVHTIKGGRSGVEDLSEP
jgi:hypothetical protein